MAKNRLIWNVWIHVLIDSCDTTEMWCQHKHFFYGDISGSICLSSIYPHVLLSKNTTNDTCVPWFPFISPLTKIRDNHWIRPVVWWPYMKLCTVSKLHVRQPAPKILRREKQDGGQCLCCYGIFWRSICAETIRGLSGKFADTVHTRANPSNNMKLVLFVYLRTI